MKQQFMKTAFFDFDGVIVDTEPIYDIYWNEAGKRYQTGIPNFASHIKGTTLPYILEKYFSDRSEEFKDCLLYTSDAADAFSTGSGCDGVYPSSEK